ncbi:alpha/beta hydrolase [Aggregicoccus sp. 17bor-14]|uniref:alpha/beta hydrolase n=1 Tax=Myxococcaceae TaxID=31 RepID=UPI00129CA1E5|nr:MULTISPECIES: alpha/beta hydrolase [Myxococcaceae]MBF5043381.1 alpha/beta hydrolase [Simulacricoccus sp. 17bor-14]MRI89139.1 alpha/beta hydrolase [Aggregicoccus sp. 17bor-14]
MDEGTSRGPEALARSTLLRQRAGAALVDAFCTGLTRGGRLLPQSRSELHAVEVLRDVAYLPDGGSAHRLDLYRPRGPGGPRPVVLYIHGGAFRALSKETHWVFGVVFARQGFVALNLNYRLAPAHPFPAALEDVAAAYCWAVQHAAHYGGDPARVVVAGESAGANLALGLALATCYRRPEPWARAVFDTGVVPRAVLPACGVLQVSDPERYWRTQPRSFFVRDRLSEVGQTYLRGARVPEEGGLELADPLLVLERAGAPARPLPAFFVACGTADVLLEDSRRLARALQQLGARCEARDYAGEPHAFLAFVHTRAGARRHWEDAFRFLAQQLH